jgi:phage gpG-like protein
VRLVLSVDTTAGRRRVEVLVGALTDLRQPLRSFGGYLRAKFKEHFAAEGPGWAPLAQSTAHRMIHSYTGRVTRGGRLRETPGLKRLRAQLKRDVVAGRVDIAAFWALKSATRSTGGGQLGEAIRFHLQGKGRKYERTLQRAAKDLDRAHAGKRQKQQRAITKHTHLLGKLASTIKAQLQGSTLVVGSFVPWAGVHNEGGPVGHGAMVPARTFASLEPDDVDMFTKMLIARAIRASQLPTT